MSSRTPTEFGAYLVTRRVITDEQYVCALSAYWSRFGRQGFGEVLLELTQLDAELLGVWLLRFHRRVALQEAGLTSFDVFSDGADVDLGATDLPTPPALDEVFVHLSATNELHLQPQANPTR